MTIDSDAPKLGDRAETPAEGKADRVGYCHPPRHTQFRPGQSGNPSGRPKRRRSFKADIAAALDAASTTAGDRTKQQAIAENLMNDALARSPLAIKIVAPIALTLDEGEDNREGVPTALEQKLLADFDRRDDSTQSSDGSDK
jgi:Family of unknown function (DUF5681)